MNEATQMVPVSAALSPLALLNAAVAQNAGIETLTNLMDLYERFEANEARKAFTADMAAFKAEPLQIFKSKQVNIPGGASFAHATLADVVDGVVATLSKHHLSHKWSIKQDKERIGVTCVITHEGGHTDEATLEAPPDDSGRKNGIQQIASTVTYLERYTLMAVCGLAARDMDDDGRSAAPLKVSAREPEGYDKWVADLKAVADEGTERLHQVWTKSPANFRGYLTRHEMHTWEAMKVTAAKVVPQ